MTNQADDSLRELILYIKVPEHTITDIEMIMHHSQGKVDFIEAVETTHILNRLSELEEGK